MELVETLLGTTLGCSEDDIHKLRDSAQLVLSQREVQLLVSEAYSQGAKDGARNRFPGQGYSHSQLFAQLMESLPDAIYFKDRESRFTSINKTLAGYFRLQDPQDAVGKSDFDFFESESADSKYSDEQEIIRSGVGWSYREEKDHQEGQERRWVISSKQPLLDSSGKVFGTFGVSRDITKKRLAQREVQRQRRLLETIIRILPCRLFIRDRDGRYLLVNEEYRNEIGIPLDYDIRGKEISEVIDDPGIPRVLAQDRKIVESGEPIVDMLEYDMSILAGKRWVLTSKIPLRTGSESIEGIVGMSLDITDQKLAEEKASKAKEALQRKNVQYEEELQVARELQEHLMAASFDDKRQYALSGASWSLKASYLYKPSQHLAGDFFHLIPLEQNQIGVLVCDVMGQGVKAALVTMLIRGLLSEIPTLLAHPSQTLQHLNKTLISLAQEEEFPRFVTATYLCIDLDAGTARISQAGHPRPIIQGDSNILSDCPSGALGPALGLIEEEEFASTEFPIQGSAQLYLFTDGILGLATKTGEEFGRNGLKEALSQAATTDISLGLQSIDDGLSAALDSEPASDDICVIALALQPKA